MANTGLVGKGMGLVGASLFLTTPKDGHSSQGCDEQSSVARTSYNCNFEGEVLMFDDVVALFLTRRMKSSR